MDAITCVQQFQSEQLQGYPHGYPDSADMIQADASPHENSIAISVIRR